VTDAAKATSSAAAASLDLGSGIQVTSILGGHLRLDGGAMFGVVPRALWEPACGPDARNRVASACRCLLIHTADALVLVDTGCGDRFDAKGRDIFAVDPTVTLANSLAAVGVSPVDITHVLFTHLHFDHCAGALRDSDCDLVPAFPDAVHIVQLGEFDDARNGRSIMRSSFLSADLEALARSVNWKWTAGDVEIVPGVRVEVTGGHTEHHQLVVVSGDTDTLLFPGDLIPTRAHLRPYWIMAYDMFPYDTFLRKQELARRACDNRWIVAWDHDPDARWSRLVDDDRGIAAIPLASDT